MSKLPITSLKASSIWLLFSGFSKSSANNFSTSRWNLLIYLFMQSLWYIISFAHTSPVSFKNMSLIWISSLLNFAASSNLSATSEDSIRNLFVSPWHLTWLQMTHGLSLGSRDVIVMNLFGRVIADVNGERSGSSGFRFGVSTLCLAPFFLYVA